MSSIEKLMLLDEFFALRKANREEREKQYMEIYLLDRMFVLEYLIFLWI